VCSNEPEETHQVVDHFLAEHADMRLDAIEHEISPQLPGAATSAGTLDVTPEQWGTDGVFVARFRRKDAP
jgi:16S rRNA (cytosine967-C5)-methyltransferase